MEQHAPNRSLERLDAFIGEWRMLASLPDALVGRAVFEWMAGDQFLVQQWGFPPPAAVGGTDLIDFGGISIISLDPGGHAFLQHYFDSRGVAPGVQDELQGRRLEIVEELRRLLTFCTSRSASRGPSARTA